MVGPPQSKGRARSGHLSARRRFEIPHFPFKYQKIISIPTPTLCMPHVNPTLVDSHLKLTWQLHSYVRKIE